MICFKCQNSINSSNSKYCMVLACTADGEVYSDILPTANLGTWHIAIHMSGDRACKGIIPGFKKKILEALGISGAQKLDFIS
jgi:hypothetical protein